MMAKERTTKKKQGEEGKGSEHRYDTRSKSRCEHEKGNLEEEGGTRKQEERGSKKKGMAEVEFCGKEKQNVVYKVQCKECEAIYIGETKRKLKERISEHLSAVKKEDVANGIAMHVKRTKHEINWREVEVLVEGRDAEKNKLRALEALAIAIHKKNGKVLMNIWPSTNPQILEVTNRETTKGLERKWNLQSKEEESENPGLKRAPLSRALAQAQASRNEGKGETAVRKGCFA